MRAARLLDAQDKAAELFVAIDERGLIRPGVGERQVTDEIRDLAAEILGVTRHWHKRIVHGGENTLATARDNPPDRVIADDDIVFVDLGPLFEEWEADFGRTFVIGDDPRKLALRNDLPKVWEAARAHFESTPDITGAQLFEHVVGLSRAAGWEFGGAIAGHLVGSSRTRRSAATRSTPMWRPARTCRCGAWIPKGGNAIGFSRCTSSTRAGSSAGSRRSCWIYGGDGIRPS